MRNTNSSLAPQSPAPWWPHCRRRLQIFGWGAILLMALPALGQMEEPAQSEGTLEVEEPRLRTYAAEYKTTAMGLDMTLKRTLSREGQVFTLINKGSVLIASLEERAQFTLTDGRIRGETFNYRLKTLGSRKREVRFLPEQGVIRSLRKKQWTEHPWKPEILDRLSQQEQLRLDLMASVEPPPKLVFTVVDGAKVEDKVMVFVGAENIDTPLGALATVHYRQLHDNPNKRSSDVWLAPELDYTMVRTVHVEDGSEISITLNKITFTAED